MSLSVPPTTRTQFSPRHQQPLLPSTMVLPKLSVLFPLKLLVLLRLPLPKLLSTFTNSSLEEDLRPATLLLLLRLSPQKEDL